MENNVTKPYRIAITETYVKEVEIYASDEYTAMQYAEDLCNESIIDLDYESFVSRDTACRGLSRPADLQLHEVYHAEEGIMAQHLCIDTVYPAHLAGEVMFIDGIKIKMDNDGQLFCRLDDEHEDRPLRDNIADIKEGDAFFWGDCGLIRTASDDARNDPEFDADYVFGDDGEVYFGDDIGKEIGKKIREILSQAKEVKPSLVEQMSAAKQRTQSDNNNQMAPEKDLEY